MISKLKVLGLVATAVLSISAFVASAAQAQFTASSATWATATSALGNDVFTTEGGSVECAAHFSGKVGTSSTAVTTTPSYYECKAFGFAEATVFNGCDYVFHNDGSFDIECPSTNKIIIVAGACEVQVGTQTGLKLVTFANETGDITAQASIEGIKYNVTKDGFLCPFSGTGERTTGKYTQISPVTAQSTSGASLVFDPLPPPETFTSNAYPTTATATGELGNGNFKTEAGSAECKSHFEGTFMEVTTILTVAPTYTECKSFGFASATVNMNGCDYVFHANGEVDLECSGANKVVITAGTCEVQIGTQTGLNSVSLSNNGNHINFKANITGIAYTVTKDGFLCPFGGTGAKTGATYTHSSALTLKPVSGGTDLTVD